jgi:tight adherence protein B
MKSGKSYSSSLFIIKERFQDSIADQVFEVLDFARTSGSRDSALTLRTLATYIRSDLSLRNEISAKHGWIKNASVLAGLAPWLLLVILSTQRSTIDAYSNAAGVTILITGVLLTLIAYFWMNRVGRISVPPRIFSKGLRG